METTIALLVLAFLRLVVPVGLMLTLGTLAERRTLLRM